MSTNELAAQWCDNEYTATSEEAFKDIAVMLRTQAAEIEELKKDESRLDWIIDNASNRGGGSGFTLSVFVPADCECVRTAIDAAIAKEKD